MGDNGSGPDGRRRVVVTGLGMVSPLGTTVEDSWSALVAGESGAGPITQFDTAGFPVDFACEVKDLDVTDYVDYKASRRMDRFTHLALAAARHQGEVCFFRRRHRSAALP